MNNEQHGDAVFDVAASCAILVACCVLAALLTRLITTAVPLLQTFVFDPARPL